MTKDEALKLALEALELHGKQYPHMVKGYCLDAITAIKEALAQPERQWVGLRDIEIASAFEGTPQSFRDKEIFTKAIEAKLKEKNNG